MKSFKSKEDAIDWAFEETDKLDIKTLQDRLRGKYECGPNNERDFSPFIAPIRLEAADRIKELEAQLEEAKGFLIDLPVTEKWIAEVAEFLDK